MTLGKISVARVLDIRLSGPQAYLSERLTAAAEGGHQYGAITPLFSKGGGAIFTRQSGTYVDYAILRLDPALAGSLFRVCRILDRPMRDPVKMAAGIQAITEFEGWHGYQLVDIVALTGFREQGVGPGTVALVCVFERKGKAGTALSLDKVSLKSSRTADGDIVACPVRGCAHIVPRMTKYSPNLDSHRDALGEYLCPDHQIYISPSTFSYEDPYCSILWRDENDMKALAKLSDVPQSKRTWARMARERDEDSLTWNTFYALEQTNSLSPVLEKVLPEMRHGVINYQTEKVIYWSVDLSGATGQVWDPLNAARHSLGERLSYGSEPDLVIVCPWEILLVEVKFTSPAVTPIKEIPEPYKAEPRWSKVFKRSPEEVLGVCGYDLLRYLLLGYELSNLLGRSFRVVLLTRPGEEESLQERVQPLLVRPDIFVHIDWEAVAQAIPVNEIRTEMLSRYLQNKTAGYDQEGDLQTLLGKATPPPDDPEDV